MAMRDKHKKSEFNRNPIKFRLNSDDILIFQAILIPLEEFLYTILNLDLVSPAEAVKLLYIDKFTRSTIWLAGIKFYSSLKANCLYYQL